MKRIILALLLIAALECPAQAGMVVGSGAAAPPAAQWYYSVTETSTPSTYSSNNFFSNANGYGAPFNSLSGKTATKLSFYYPSGAGTAGDCKAVLTDGKAVGTKNVLASCEVASVTTNAWNDCTISQAISGVVAVGYNCGGGNGFGMQAQDNSGACDQQVFQTVWASWPGASITMANPGNTGCPGVRIEAQ